MDKSIKCSDLGVDCGWSTTAHNETQLLRKLAQHAEEHGFKEIPNDWKEKITFAVKDA